MGAASCGSQEVCWASVTDVDPREPPAVAGANLSLFCNQPVLAHPEVARWCGTHQRGCWEAKERLQQAFKSSRPTHSQLS